MKWISSSNQKWEKEKPDVVGYCMKFNPIFLCNFTNRAFCFIMVIMLMDKRERGAKLRAKVLIQKWDGPVLENMGWWTMIFMWRNMLKAKEKDDLRCKFLASAMKASTPENSGRFTSKCLGLPYLTCCIKECLELSSHDTESRWKPEEKTVCFQQLFRPDLLHIICFWRSFHLVQYHIRQCLRHLLQTSQVKLITNQRIGRKTLAVLLLKIFIPFGYILKSDLENSIEEAFYLKTLHIKVIPNLILFVI